ncbi:ATP-binding protein [Bowmanella pacifica]|uniref:histidine kinase n=1 Tax=Bowmanella pacifica TaxID=502051 RepID=A0A917YS47_9ALTE|nr:ATP-binding protein [Bowmanella pacifica]GGO64465.1 hypothetical protein GCM10010982_03970 [Bowmanella pacifica]
MSRIYISLLLTALLTLFSLGWGIDNWVAQHRESQTPHDYPHLSKMFAALTEQINQNTMPATAQIAQLNQLIPLSLTLESSSNLALPSDLFNALHQPGGLLLDSANGPYLLAALPAHPEHLLRMALPPVEEVDLDRDLILTLAMYLGLALMMGIWLLPLTRRLSLLTRTAHKFGQGDLQARVPASRLSYIQDLESSFNQMAQRIEQLIAENRLLASSLSHDLRTPLACFRFGLDAAIDTPDSTEKNTYLRRLENDLERMENLVTAFLDFASLERQATKIQPKSLNLTELLRNAVEENQPLALTNRLRLEHQLGQEAYWVMGDAMWLNRAISNIISNASRYAQSRVILTLHSVKEQLEIHIEDDGPGIAEEKLQDVFKPFVSLEQNRQRDTYGLGLAIVERVVAWHGGAIRADRSTLRGARFILSLPRHTK